jgi:hypothetical protein
VPWRGPTKDGDAWPTLGHQIANMIQRTCAIPDREYAGDPFMLTNEMYRFLLHFYRINPETGRFVYFRGAQLVRPQKWGKGPFSAAWVCAEAQGPALFDGWAPKAGVDEWGWEYSAGEPLGRLWPTPVIQITAASEDQAGNVWQVLVPMIELGDLRADIPDTGDTRINLPGGGRIVPVTSAARTRLGQRVTAVVQDQTESWTRHNRGRHLADTQRRNLAGTNGRFLETPNAWDPLDESVAQQTSEDKEPGVYLDDVEPGPGSIRNRQQRRRCIRRVYRDSIKAPAKAPWKPWIDIDRIDAECEALLKRDPQQAERYFLNRKMAAEDAAFDHEKWKKRTDATVVVPDKSVIVIGVDGARLDDALAVIGCDVRQAHLFTIGIWEVPEAEKLNDDYEHPLDEVDGAVIDVMERLKVWRLYIDPGSSSGNITVLVDRWKGRWGDKKVIEWPMHRPKPTAYAVRAFNTALNRGDFTHDGDVDLARHVKQARKDKVNVYDEDHRQMWTIAKDRPGSPRKIDGAAASVLTWEARSDAIAAGASKQKSKKAVFY